MLAIFVERAWAFENLLVLLNVVVLGTRFVDGCDDVVWSAAVILTRFGPFWPITATVPMVTAVVIVAVAALVIETIIIAVSWAMSACILMEAHFGFFGVGVLVGSSDHLANACGWLVVELGAKLTMVESSGEGGDDLSFRDVRNRIPHLKSIGCSCGGAWTASG